VIPARRSSAPILLALLALPLYFISLGNVGIIGPDEARYAAIGIEMAQSADWITPRLWGEVWLEKPPLTYWLVAIGQWSGLAPEVASRCCMALLSLAYLIFQFFALQRLFGERAAWFATAPLATSAGWVVYSQFALTDLPMSVALGVAWLVFAQWLEEDSAKPPWAAGALLGMAVLAKGLLPLALFLPALWLSRTRWRALLWLTLPFLLVAGPWYGLMFSTHGEQFWQEFFVRHHFQRFTSEAVQHVQPFWFYLAVLPGIIFPWSGFVFALRWPRAMKPAEKLLLWSFVFGLLFLSASRNKLPGYILPLLVPFFALTGLQLSRRANANRWLAPAFVLLAVLPSLPALLPVALNEGLSRSDFDLSLTALLIGLLVAVAVWWWRPGRTLALGVTAIALLVVWLKLSLYPLLDEKVSARARWQRERLNCNPTASRGYHYSLSFYLQREAKPCESAPR
jgi:4-amino-4-deoxy-L-arabinose transferase-like glycosyltransferase